MTTATQPSEADVLIEMDAAAYLRDGIGRPGLSAQEWATRFVLLGGTKCRVSVYDNPDPNAATMVVRVAGTPEAIDFVRASVTQSQTPEHTHRCANCGGPRATVRIAASISNEVEYLCVDCVPAEAKRPYERDPRGTWED